MTRRGAGEGSIRTRPDGRLEARYTGSDGRRHYIMGRDHKNLQAKLRDALRDAAQGIQPVSQQLTLAAWLETWLATSVRPRLRPRTIESYEMVVKLYLAPAPLGRTPVAKLTPAAVQAALTALAARSGPGGRHLSPTTVRYVYSVLRIALGRALKAGVVHRNVATLLDPPRKATVERHPLTADQIGTFLGSVDGDRQRALYVAAIGLGMRQGELLALRWSDIDLEAGTVSIRHTLQRGTRTLAAPKTERARRTLRLGVEVSTALRDHRRRQLEERIAAAKRWKDEDYVFTTPAGRPLDTKHVTADFQVALAAVGLPHQRFHDLRHACATQLIEQGEELAVVSKILGHSDLGTTADVYAHLTPAMAQRVADRMDGVLRRRSAGA